MRLQTPLFHLSTDSLRRLGILQDVILLSEAGYTRTSSSLDFMMHLVHDREYLVWIEIAMAFRRILEAWWEQPAEVLGGGSRRSQGRFSNRSSRSSAWSTSPTTTLMLASSGEFGVPDSCTRGLIRIACSVLVIAAAAAADSPSFVSRLFSRSQTDSFYSSVITHLQQSFMLLASGQGDATSADLALVIVSEAVKHGSEMEYGIALAIYNAPPTPQHQLAAIAGLTSTRSPALIQQTAGMLMSGQVAEQNMLRFLIVRLFSLPDPRAMLTVVLRRD